MTTCEEHKELGSKAYQAGNYQTAIAEWSQAISTSSQNDKAFLKIVHSNRCAAYSILKQFTEALKDAEKCVSLDSTWSKGYTRKGDALYSLWRYTEAFNAYNSALRYASPEEKQSCEKKLEQAMKKIRENDSTSDQGYSASSPVQSTKLGYIQGYFRICVFICLFVYMLPLGQSNSLMASRVMTICAVVTRAISLYEKFGIPKISVDYAQRVLSDSSGMGLFLALMLMFGKPYILALLSIAVAELVHFTSYIGQYGRANLSMLQQQLAPLLSSYGKSLLRGADASAVLADLFQPRNVNLISQQLVNGSAYLEVLQGVFVIAELLLPTRNMMFTVLWWQYLQMRYMMDRSGEVKSAFRSLDQNIQGLLSNRICPPILRSLYDQLKSYLAKKVEPPTANNEGGGIGSMMPKCTIM